MAFSEMNIVAETNHGHVNNVKLFDYLDQARRDWYHYCILSGVEAVAVNVNVNFKKEVFHNDKLMVRTWMDQLGNTSFSLKQTIINEGKELVVSAEVVLATINRLTRGKVMVPNEVRSLLKQDTELNLCCDA